MKRSIAIWQVMGFAFVSLGGTLLHFLYDWTGGSPIAAVISGTNESTWEHMKLLFVPLVLYALFEHCFFPEQEDFWCVKAVGTSVGVLLIPALFYTANGGFGKTPDWLNITFFFVTAALTFLLETWLFRIKACPCKSRWHAWVLLGMLALLFVLFTFSPPKLPLFQDPVTGGYGIT